jgi:hypothetical protein
MAGERGRASAAHFRLGRAGPEGGIGSHKETGMNDVSGAWRSGKTNLLQSSLARAVLFSALTTGTAFGTLWISSHPGTASMGDCRHGSPTDDLAGLDTGDSSLIRTSSARAARTAGPQASIVHWFRSLCAQSRPKMRIWSILVGNSMEPAQWREKKTTTHEQRGR